MSGFAIYSIYPYLCMYFADAAESGLSTVKLEWGRTDLHVCNYNEL